jgi:hypothetical protein
MSSRIFAVAARRAGLTSRALAAPFALLLLGVPCGGLVGALTGCEEKKPDRLALDPGGPFRFEKKGQKEELKVAAFRGPQPYVKAVPATWSSSDTSVATVDEQGVVTSTGSGQAEITASAWGLTTSAAVSSTIVGSVEVKDDVPKPLKLNHKGWPLKVTVKDDKGTIIEKPKIMYRATDYCVEVEDDGVLKPLADGDCDVVVSVADQSARIKLQVRE